MMELEQDLTFLQKFLKILSSLSYLIGEFYARMLKGSPGLMDVIESFIEGWLDGKEFVPA